MQLIKIDSELSPEEERFLEGKNLDSQMYDILVGTTEEDVKLLKPDGSLLLYLSKKGLPAKKAKAGLPFLRKITDPITNRGTAAGVGSDEVSYQSSTRLGYRTNTVQIPYEQAIRAGRNGIAGYFDRYSRLPYARVCRYTSENPELWRGMMKICNHVDGLFQRHVPEKYRRQRYLADNSSRDWIIGQTAFTTLTINKNFRTSGHYDAGDFEHGFGCMLCLKTGGVSGGDLILPRYRVGVRLDSQDIIFFDVHSLHGNSEITNKNKGTRTTVVFYFRKNIVRCGDSRYEADRAKRVRNIGHLYDPEEIERGDRIIEEALTL